MLPPSITKNQLLANFDTFVFDADGVLWTGDIPIPGASQWINTLLDDPEKSVFITTNNSTKTLEQYIGVKCFGTGPDLKEDYVKDGDFINEVDVTSKVPKAVVVSFDSHFSYPKLMKAANFLSDPSVEFLVCNEDTTFPGPVPGMILPETGPWSAAIQNVSGRKPDIIFGKPHKEMANFLKSRVNPEKFDARRTVMFGDRLDTDMMFGKTNGFTTVWMQTGVNSVLDIEKSRQSGEITKIPDFTCQFSEFFP
ncbi:Protein CBG19872 [Caenorhabditis briggsae]|uniref:Protein CBG19872 n=1 Tax=Caenorhabditis briggsae TaxID=6238 RepID=A8XWM3_CAEBR|nr:Protein CBG19872 [Caenorhabditis briggsae]CAP37042.2 Protein CBG19872 [Caenorhabditis briggsae]